MKFLSLEKLSKNMHIDNSGYLICENAILARTGKQQYQHNELFQDSDDDSIIDVDRPENEVFDEKTLASFENKAICDEHPDVDVTPVNYKELSVGFVRDIHKGYDNGQPVMMGTLVITDAEAIEEVKAGKRQLSCGYDCDLQDGENGMYQCHIRGNHVALCEQGRAGIARIVDSKTVNDTAKTITTQCYIFDGDKILIQDRIGPAWKGLAVPGGHVQINEKVENSCIREVREETGLTVGNLELFGTHEYISKDEGQCIAMLYKTSSFNGELHGSEEGDVMWMPVDEVLASNDCAEGFKDLLTKAYTKVRDSVKDSMTMGEVSRLVQAMMKSSYVKGRYDDHYDFTEVVLDRIERELKNRGQYDQWKKYDWYGIIENEIERNESYYSFNDSINDASSYTIRYKEQGNNPWVEETFKSFDKFREHIFDLGIGTRYTWIMWVKNAKGEKVYSNGPERLSDIEKELSTSMKDSIVDKAAISIQEIDTMKDGTEFWIERKDEDSNRQFHEIARYKKTGYDFTCTWGIQFIHYGGIYKESTKLEYKNGRYSQNGIKDMLLKAYKQNLYVGYETPDKLINEIKAKAKAYDSIVDSYDISYNLGHATKTEHFDNKKEADERYEELLQLSKKPSMSGLDVKKLYKDSVKDAVTTSDLIRFLKNISIKEGEVKDYGNKNFGLYILLNNHGKSVHEEITQYPRVSPKEVSACLIRIWKDGKLIYMVDDQLNLAKIQAIKFLNGYSVTDSIKDADMSEQYKKETEKQLSKWGAKEAKIWRETNWKARNYKELLLGNNSFKKDVKVAGTNIVLKNVKFVLEISPNPIFEPRYVPEGEYTTYRDYCWTADGTKHNGYTVIGRADTWKNYNAMTSDSNGKTTKLEKIMKIARIAKLQKGGK